MSSNLQNSIWPNEGGTLGQNKVQIPDGVTTTWPTGDALVGNFVYQNGKLVGFVDTKALTVNESKSTVINYDYVDIELPFTEGEIAITRGERSKYFNVRYNPINDDNVVITLKYKGCKTVDDVKAVDPDYLTTDIVDGVWSEGLGDLTDGGEMFAGCYNLTSFSSDLSNLAHGEGMFYSCYKLASFSADLPSLTHGEGMFNNCYSLTSFSSDLLSLTNGAQMFTNCKLDTASVQHIADTINTYSGPIHIGIGNTTPNEQEEAAFNAMVDKGWIVYVDVYGGNPSKWNPTSLTPIDGEEQQTPIPYWAKPVPSDEQHAQYVDEQGNFYNILGGNFIYGDNLETYGMFTSLEDAAANMRLTPYVKPVEKA